MPGFCLGGQPGGLTWPGSHAGHSFQASPSLLFTVIFMWCAGENLIEHSTSTFHIQLAGQSISLLLCGLLVWQYIATIFTNKALALGQRQSVQFHYSPPNTPVNGTCVYRLLWWWNYGCRDNVALVNGRGMGWAKLEWQVGLAEWYCGWRDVGLGPVSGDATSDASPLPLWKVWSAFGLADLASATFHNLSAFFLETNLPFFCLA